MSTQAKPVEKGDETLGKEKLNTQEWNWQKKLILAIERQVEFAIGKKKNSIGSAFSDIKEKIIEGPYGNYRDLEKSLNNSLDQIGGGGTEIEKKIKGIQALGKKYIDIEIEKLEAKDSGSYAVYRNQRSGILIYGALDRYKDEESLKGDKDSKQIYVEPYPGGIEKRSAAECIMVQQSIQAARWKQSQEKVRKTDKRTQLSFAPRYNSEGQFIEHKITEAHDKEEIGNPLTDEGWEIEDDILKAHMRRETIPVEEDQRLADKLIEKIREQQKRRFRQLGRIVASGKEVAMMNLLGVILKRVGEKVRLDSGYRRDLGGKMMIRMRKRTPYFRGTMQITSRKATAQDLGKQND